MLSFPAQISGSQPTASVAVRQRRQECCCFFLLHTCIVRTLTLSSLLLSMVTAAPGRDSVWRTEKAVDISVRKASLQAFSQAGMGQK